MYIHPKGDTCRVTNPLNLHAIPAIYYGVSGWRDHGQVCCHCCYIVVSLPLSEARSRALPLKESSSCIQPRNSLEKNFEAYDDPIKCFFEPLEMQVIQR